MRLATKLSIVLQSQMVARLLELPAQFPRAARVGRPGATGYPARNVATYDVGVFSTLLVGVISSMTAILLLILTYPPAGAVGLVAADRGAWSFMSTSRQRRTLAMRMVREQVDVATVTVGTLGQVEVIKAAGAEDHATARWTSAHNRFLAATQELGERTVSPGVCPAS